ncbi:MAG: 8-amino-7-oxononanoate synthase [Verrucomicrobiae bacterium]|nr:8-amino-7-oxononanoate synthase [Verrucomicrobiae bacterium]
MRSPEEELGELEARQLRRRLRRIDSPQGTHVTVEGREFLNFSSNDYLGLANDSRLKAAFIDGVERFGAGSGASRLVCGTMGPHAELEESIAAFKRSEAALTFSSGYATSVGTLSALMGKGDVIILDKLCHASLIDGARLSGATLRVFPHNDIGKLESHLQWAEKEVASANGRILVVTESVFSMDGDRAPLAEIVALKERHGAWLLLDEAHAFGVIGPQGSGLAAELGWDDGRIDLQMGTFSKAAGLSGGYLCARRAVTDLLINRARSFIYSTAPTPALAVAAMESIALISGEEGERRRERLWQSVRLVAEAIGVTAGSAILPIILGSNEATLEASEALKENGFLIPAIRYPTVPKGQARLRVTLSAAHQAEDVACLTEAVRPFLPGAPGE